MWVYTQKSHKLLFISKVEYGMDLGAVWHIGMHGVAWHGMAWHGMVNINQ